MSLIRLVFIAAFILAAGACGTAQESGPPAGYDACAYDIGQVNSARLNKASREAILQEQLLVPPEYGIGDSIDLSGDFDWSAYNDEQPTLQWWLNGMKYLIPSLNRDSGATDESRQAARRLVKNWIASNPPGNSASDFAWDNHATANRSEQLACLASIYPDDHDIRQSAADHMAFLESPDNYDGAWNHGLDQDMGLLALGCSVGDHKARRVARDRILAALDVMVDAQGVSNEQAIGYQEYAYTRFLDVQARLDACGVDYDHAAFARVGKMPAFLVHATQPDGTLVPIGDIRIRGVRALSRHRPLNRQTAFSAMMRDTFLPTSETSSTPSATARAG